LLKLMLTKAKFVLHAFQVVKLFGRSVWECAGKFLSRGRFEEGSMYKSKLRLLGVSALVGAGLIAAGPADAQQVRVGNVDLQFDIVGSVGAVFRAEDADPYFISAAGGGRDKDVDEVNLVNSLGLTAVGGPLEALKPLYTENCGTPTNVNSNYGDMCNSTTGYFLQSANRDDARRNFSDSGEIMSAVGKITTDISADFGSGFSGFARVTAFYDGVLNETSSYGLDYGVEGEGEDRVGMGIELLDAYINYDFDIGNMPAQIRVGNQVINWGESTFILGGNSVFSPIDVPALRRPGAEIKEALLPVEALYASVGVTDTVTVEAYVGGSENFRLDVGGTGLAGNDYIGDGNAWNDDAIMIGGSKHSGTQAPCSLNVAEAGADAQTIGGGGVPAAGATRGALLAATTAHSLTTIAALQGEIDCDTAGIDIFDTRDERMRLDNPYETTIAHRTADQDTDGDSMGLAVRWYAENINSTEFAFYAQRYQSRIPYVTFASSGPQFGWSAQGIYSGATSRGTAPAVATNPVTKKANCDQSDLFTALGLGAAGTALEARNAGITVSDPHDLADAARDSAMAILNAGDTEATRGQGQASRINDNGDPLTLAEAAQIACIGLHGDTNEAAGAAVALIPTGHTYFSNTYGGVTHRLLYPEDIDVVGASFATTLFGWGVQGEIAYREEMPLQLDGDTIAAAAIQTTGLFATGGLVESTYNAYATQPYAEHRAGLIANLSDYEVVSQGHREHLAWLKEEVWNWDIGTTATYTSSNPVVRLLGANSAVLLTEFAGVFAPNIEDDFFIDIVDESGNAQGAPLANKCRGGSDIPLGSLFALDVIPDDGKCRPTRNSWGAVLLGRLTYNNVFGSAFSVSPTFIVNQGMDGRSPTPAGSWIEDVGSYSMSLGIDYQEVSASLSYRKNFGPVRYTDQKDMDFVSINVKTSF
jgi:hypothetical protein